MGIKPLHQYFVIEVESQKTSTSGLIQVIEKPTPVARVIRVPSGCEEVSVGDRVAIGLYNPLDIRIDGQTFTLIDYTDIFGVIEEEA